MTLLSRGANAALGVTSLEIGLQAPEPVDLSAVLVGSSGRVSSDADLIFYNQPAGPGIRLSGSGPSARLSVDLPSIQPAVDKIAVIASLDGTRSSHFGQLAAGLTRVVISGGGAIVAEYVPDRLDQETALILVELYRRHGAWKVRAVGQGWRDGLGGIARSFGVDVSSPAPARPSAPIAVPPVQQPRVPVVPAPTSRPAQLGSQPPRGPDLRRTAPAAVSPPAPPAGAISYAPPTPSSPPAQGYPAAPGYPPPAVGAPVPGTSVSVPPHSPSVPRATVNLGKVTLAKRGDARRIDLSKDGTPQPMRFNLNWNARRGIRKGADLDLGCMVETADGTRKVIQPLGGYLGDQYVSPWIVLDKDDRSGHAADGENLTIFRPDLIQRVLVFAMIYEGAKDFASVGAYLTIRDASGGETTVVLDNPSPQLTWCAMCMVTADAGGVRITKEEQYFRSASQADAHYGFGFQWRAGRK